VNVAIRRPGRPRDDSREAALLEATVAVLGEVGYDRLTIDAVAARAKASKATVYRRWATKAEMVVDALSRDQPASLLPEDTGSLRGDLLALVSSMLTRLSSSDGPLICALTSAASRDPELARAMRCHTHGDKLALAHAIVDRAVARGELLPEAPAPLLIEVMPAIVFNRLLVTGEPLDQVFAEHLIDNILIPLLANRSSS
jgi:AcrR family transcriptional regulator